MADNIAVTEGSGKTVATDDVSGVQYQVVKIATGADGSATLISTTNPLPVAGTIAHDSADSGNPVKIGAKVETSLEGATMAADGDRTDMYADADGVLITKNMAPFGDIITERVTNTDGNSTAFTNFGAGGSGIRNYVTTIAVYNSSATNGFIDLRDGTAGSVLFTIPLPTVGGSVITFPVPLRQTTANTALAYDVSGALSTVYISLVGFQSKL